MSLDLETGKMHYFRDGVFQHYEPLTTADEMQGIDNLQDIIESAVEMETYIIHAIKENLPVYLVN
jgi:hypothetical protein